MLLNAKKLAKVITESAQDGQIQAGFLRAIVETEILAQTEKLAKMLAAAEERLIVYSGDGKTDNTYYEVVQISAEDDEIHIVIAPPPESKTPQKDPEVENAIQQTLALLKELDVKF